MTTGPVANGSQEAGSGASARPVQPDLVPAISRWERVRPRLLYAIRCGVVCTFLAAVFVIVRAAELHRSLNERHSVHVARWDVLEHPTFTDRGGVLDLRATAALHGRTLHVYDRVAVSRLVAELEALPQVRAVHEVRRRFPAGLDLRLELRRPRAAIARGAETATFAVVDDEGVVLWHGQGDRPAPDGRPLPWITGTAGPLPPPASRCGADVQGALALLEDLSSWPTPVEREHLALLDEIDVANFAGRSNPRRPEVVLRSAPLTRGEERASRCVVEWGRLTSDRGEPDFEQKTRHLLRALVADPALATLDRVLVAYDDLRVVPRDLDGSWQPPLELVALRRP